MALLGGSEEHQRETYAREQPFLAGETVTPGHFRCQACGHELEVEQGKVPNPPVCPTCQHDRWDPRRQPSSVKAAFTSESDPARRPASTSATVMLETRGGNERKGPRP